ncbi:hypothetical protein N7474_005643 [Penicillium riverlandense]|uniref:uncharacterized protein n=1 Tax=Penicillium riverlandense TaxID=1903569 RepID=UPI00254767B7|nr:uncharacterized protein N7474_005643 [Penicillium riverlandense]KAJ5820052.1 hypothetical protein N7474_005643 [Penicillium riverlandense]
MSHIQLIDHFVLPIGQVIDFEDPQPSSFRIIEKIKEDNYQAEPQEIHDGIAESSYCAAKYLCVEPSSQKRAFMRVYMQVPWKGTEMYPGSERQKQVTTESKEFISMEIVAMKAFWKQNSAITPPLLGYKERVQDPGMPVPDGFATYFVWGVVPGICLGDSNGPTTFQTLPDAEQELIHETFLQDHKKLRAMGFFPAFGKAKNLVWDRARGKLYFVGFRDCNPATEGHHPVDERNWVSWGMTREPRKSSAWEKGAFAHITP